MAAITHNFKDHFRSCFLAEDFHMIIFFLQNMYNLYQSAERRISHIKKEENLNYSLSPSWWLKISYFDLK